MTDAERQAAFQASLKEVMGRRADLQKSTAEEVARLLQVALAQINTKLALTPSDYEAWYLPQLKEAVRQALLEFNQSGSQLMSTAVSDVWGLGVASLDLPLAAAGVQLALPMVDGRQLLAMRAFLTDRIENISTLVVNKINSELALTMIGAQPIAAAATNIAKIMETGRGRAYTIIRTEMGRAYSIAQHERNLQWMDSVPGLKKQWRKSGKLHSRLSHVAIDGQVQAVDEPFKVGAARLMFPRDPAGSAADTINCGCDSLPFMESWEVVDPSQPLII